MWVWGAKSRPLIDHQRWSCLVLTNSLWPQIGHQRWPCLVSGDVAMASSWLSMTVMLGTHKFIVTSSNWSPKVAMLGPRWHSYDLDLTLNDCHAWFLLDHRDHELAIKDGHAWSQMMRLRPRFGSHRLPCLVPKQSLWPWIGFQWSSCLVLR